MRDGIANSKIRASGRGRGIMRARHGKLAFCALLLLAPHLCIAEPVITIANNVFPSTPVGQSITQNVTLTFNAATVIQSIGIQYGFSDYALETISGCTADGITVNPAGTVCTLPITYTPIAPGSLASPALSRNAPLLVTVGQAGATTSYAFGLTGAATGPIAALSQGTFTRYAGVADASATDPGDDGLGYTTAGYSGDGGPALEAQFRFTNAATGQSEGQGAMAVDSAGDLFLADAFNYVIRRIDAATGNVTLYAGEPGVPAIDNYSTNSLQVVDGVPATSSPLSLVNSLTVDGAGNLYFLDLYSTSEGSVGAVLREVNAATGIISTVAGSSQAYIDTPYTGAGTCADVDHCGDGGPATIAFLSSPVAMTMDGAGNIYIYQAYGNIREINASTGIITTTATPSAGTNEIAGYGMAMGADGDLYVANYDPNATSASAEAAYYVTQVDPVTGNSIIVAGTNPPTANGCQETGSPIAGWFLALNTTNLSSDASGNLYGFTNENCNSFANEYEYEFWMSLNSSLGYELYLDQRGAGDYGPGTVYNAIDGLYNFPYLSVAGAAPDNDGDLYMMSSDNQIARLNTGVAVLQDFGTQNDGTTSAPQTVVLWNMGNAVLEATVTMPVDFVLSPGTDPLACSNPAVLDAGQYCDLDIAFSPTTNGTLNEAVAITDQNNRQVQAQVSGTAAGTPIPRGTFAPESYDFGSQPVNATTSPQPIVFTNGGGATLDIDSISIAGPDASDFAETNNCPSTLAPGVGCTINVTFTPGAVNSFSAALSIADNTTLSPQTAALSGTGAAPLTGNISINETIQVADSPALSESTLLNIGETIHVNDAGPGTTLNPSTLLPISETIHVEDADSVVPVSKADSSVTLTASPSTALAGNPVELTAVVKSASSRVTTTPTGSVSFFLGSTLLYTAPLSAGSASFFTSNLLVGVNSLTAVYSGDADFNGSTSTPVTVSVAKANSSVSLTASPSTALIGSAVTLTAVVQSATAGTTTTPKGSVSLYLGSTLLSTAPVVGDSTRFVTMQLPAGVDSITAVYSGNADFNGSTSSIVSVTILNKANSSVSLTASPSTALIGSAVTLTAVVQSATADFRATPTGSVSFYLGSTLLGTASLVGDSTSFVFSQLPLGANSLTAVYSGDADFNGSTSAPVTVTIAKADSSVSLTSSPSAISAGDSVSFTAVVKSASMGTTATPIGSVSFFLGSTPLGSAALSSGVASLVTTQLPPGVDSITAVYSGDADFNGSSSASISDQVSSFALTLGRGSAPVFPGEPAVVTLTASPSGGAFTNPIIFSASGLPAGAAASFEPSSITPGNTAQESTLTIQTANQSTAKDSERFFGLRSATGLCILLPLVGLSRIRREGKYGFRLMLFAIAALAAASPIGGCGGGFFVQPPQTYSITITATSGPVTQSSVFKLTIE